MEIQLILNNLFNFILFPVNAHFKNIWLLFFHIFIIIFLFLISDQWYDTDRETNTLNFLLYLLYLLST